MLNICVVTGTRAEYGLLKPLILKLRENNAVSLMLLVTGSHLSERFGNTQDEIISDNIDFIKIPIPLDDDTKAGMAYSTGVALTEFSRYFKYNRPDVLVVLGDRFEVFAAASAAHIIGIPIAHISGGDVTEGAVDDAIRHCITKMSNLHFPGCEQSRKRIIQMGEQPDCVFNVGEPGVENCLKMKLMTRDELASSLAFDGVKKDFAVVTFHPVTLENDTAIAEVHELIRAMNDYPDMHYIITLANADAGGRSINDIWLSEKRKHGNWYVIPSLGALRYLSSLKYARFVLGNSSSGIIEAPSMGLPTINIGSRQKGRMIADSVVCCNTVYMEISKAIETVLSENFKNNLKNTHSPFGEGNTSDSIIEILLNYLKNNHQNLEKHFFDVDF